jgi:acetylornithine deacetylase
VQVNVVADSAVVDFEIRSLAQDDPAPRIADLTARAAAIADRYRALAPEAAITLTRDWDYPGLATPPDDPAVALVQGLSGDNRPPFKVTYGTEGGLFQARLGLPTVVCGPGHMAQGHTPDEFIETAELARCQAMLARLTAGLEAA